MNKKDARDLINGHMTYREPRYDWRIAAESEVGVPGCIRVRFGFQGHDTNPPGRRAFEGVQWLRNERVIDVTTMTPLDLERAVMDSIIRIHNHEAREDFKVYGVAPFHPHVASRGRALGGDEMVEEDRNYNNPWHPYALQAFEKRADSWTRMERDLIQAATVRSV